MSTAQEAPTALATFLARDSFIELRARERAFSLLDEGTGTELLGPFDRVESPWLPMQGIVPQSDDGCVVVLGRVNKQRTVVVAIEGAFQGGSIGEVSGAKISSALALALRDTQNGNPTAAVLLLETGGVRLQEANLGLAVIAEIQADIIALKRHVPVVAVITGMTGCFGGMSIAAALCSHILMTRQARFGLNGPEVIEQEAGIAEFDASNRQAVWSVVGGKQRKEMGFADALVEDDAAAIASAVRRALNGTLPANHRVNDIEASLQQLASTPTNTAAPTTTPQPEGRGRAWFRLLAGEAADAASTATVLVKDAPLGEGTVRYISVVPNPASRFHRARKGEVGLEEAWTLAKRVRETLVASEKTATNKKRPIIAIVDVPSQAYGRLEEQLCISLAFAAAVEAYAAARLAGHPIIALVLGGAFSGAFLAHGYQANRILALDAPGVLVHAMGKGSAARIMRQSVADFDKLSDRILPMSYGVASYAKLGTLHQLLAKIDPDAPTPSDIARVKSALTAAIADARSAPLDLGNRLLSAEARANRSASIAVRTKMTEQWSRATA